MTLASSCTGIVPDGAAMAPLNGQAGQDGMVEAGGRKANGHAEQLQGKLLGQQGGGEGKPEV